MQIMGGLDHRAVVQVTAVGAMGIKTRMVAILDTAATGTTAADGGQQVRRIEALRGTTRRTTTITRPRFEYIAIICMFLPATTTITGAATGIAKSCR